MTRMNDVYTFEQGIPGFEHLRSFTVLQMDEDTPFRLLQSTEEEGVGLIVVSPFIFLQEYELELPLSLQNELGITQANDVEVLSVVTLNAATGRVTMNLLAPIILNCASGRGKQHILQEGIYPSNYVILDKNASEGVGKEGAGC